MATKDSQGKTNAVRLSFRTTPNNRKKIDGIAKAKGWRNAQGTPNVSAVLNFLIERFEMPPKKRGKSKHNG